MATLREITTAKKRSEDRQSTLMELSMIMEVGEGRRRVQGWTRRVGLCSWHTLILVSRVEAVIMLTIDAQIRQSLMSGNEQSGYHQQGYGQNMPHPPAYGNGYR